MNENKRKNRAYGPLFKRFREIVMLRNDGMCGLCGQAKATECHHSPMKYPDGGKEALYRYEKGQPLEGDLREDHLVQLCSQCHDNLVTRFRKFIKNGATVGEIIDYLMLIWPATVEKMREDAKYRKSKMPPQTIWVKREMPALEKAPMSVLRNSGERQSKDRKTLMIGRYG